MFGSVRQCSTDVRQQVVHSVTCQDKVLSHQDVQFWAIQGLLSVVPVVSCEYMKRLLNGTGLAAPVPRTFQPLAGRLVAHVQVE